MSAAISMSEVVGAIRDLILTDADIAEYCEDTFDKSLTVWVGFSARDGEPYDAVPLLVIVPTSARIGDSDDDHAWRIDLDVLIADDRRGDLNENGAVEQGSIYTLDALMELVIAAVRRIDQSTNLSADVVEYEINTEVEPGIGIGTLGVECRAPNLISGEVTLNG